MPKLFHWLKVLSVLVILLLTCKGNDENDGDVNEEKLEVSQVAENLNIERWINSHTDCFTTTCF